ncbi:hypothetical protein MML48_2g00003608 [Holotrichia oblita]|uniref:Uncharacterized protein n=1 Tax=Holotrichia oblita TaxID=644536 RepID=A0ACB9TQW4_HOLOL|nr:hypothetical protein MML48_2g00003608 [Holotrichia oblita]
MSEDVLQEIPNEDLPKLINLYKNHQKEAPHVFSLLHTCIAWKIKKPNSNYLTFFGINGDWLVSGTFILLMQYGCYDFFVFTLGNHCQAICRALLNTEIIDWTRRMTWNAVMIEHAPTIVTVLELKTPCYKPISGGFWVLERERAVAFKPQCPDDIYVGKLNQSHVTLINSYWPHRYEGSEVYLGTFIEMNTSYGIFLKSNDKLVSWGLKDYMGQLRSLHTLPEYQRRGYCTLITKILSKEIAEEGYHPIATVVTGNTASETMLEKLGFHQIKRCIYFECNSIF